MDWFELYSTCKNNRLYKSSLARHNKQNKLTSTQVSLFTQASLFLQFEKKKATVKLLAHLCTKPVNFTACYKAFSVKVQKTSTVCG